MVGLIDKSEILTKCYEGNWPSFHDAEVLDVHLWRGWLKPGAGWDSRNVFPRVTLKIRILEATQSGATGHGHDILATFRFHDVDTITIEHFDHINIIDEFHVESQERGTYRDGTPLPPYLTVRIGGSLEVAFRCFRIEVVEAVAYQHDT